MPHNLAALSAALFAAMLSLAFFGAYMVILPPFCDFNIQNDDGLDHACNIANGHDLFHQHRIFYTKIGDLFTRTFYASVQPPELAATLGLRLESAVFGAAGVYLFFFLVLYLTSSRPTAFLAAASLGASRGYFLFSSVPESYVPAAAAVLLCFLVFERARRSMKPCDFALLGAANFFAVTIRQTNIIFTVPLILWIFMGPDKKRRSKLFLRYFLTLFAATSLAYIAVFVMRDGGFNSSEFLRWVKGYESLPELTRWEYLRWINSRNTLIRIMCCYGLWPTMAQTWMVRDALGPTGRVLDIFVQVLLFLATAILVIAAVRHFRSTWRLYRETLAVAFSWFVVHELFYTYELPYLLYTFTAPTIFVVFLFLYLHGASDRASGFAVRASRLLLPVFLLASSVLTVRTVNGTSIWDAYEFMRETSSPGDLVITRDVREASILRFLMHRRAYTLDYWENRWDRVLDSHMLRSLIEETSKEGRKIFLKSPANKPRFDVQERFPFFSICFTEEMIRAENSFFADYARKGVRYPDGTLWGWELLKR